MDTQELQSLKNKFDIIGNDASLNEALETAVAIAPTDLTVLVWGESGVGKENIPKIIHQNSTRRNQKYFAVNCGAIPEGTIDSELFGHVKGSFTGATETRKGYFEEANGGTLFLDEVGELPMASQAKLLRVLQNGEYIKVGSSKVERTDVRVIAATNQNLEYAISQGKFRADLYYRLNVISIHMPSLKDRKDDIYLLFRKFTADFSEKYSMAKVTLTNDAIDMLINYRWPGNIRQLKSFAQTVSALEGQKISKVGERCVVDAATLSKYMPKDDPSFLPAKVDSTGGETISSSDKQMLIKALVDMKREIDDLKIKVNSYHQVEAPSQEREDPEWQGFGTPVSSEDVSHGKIIEVQRQNDLDEHAQQGDSLSITDVNKELILKALEKYNGNRKMAAKELGISERTLYRKIDKFGLDSNQKK